MNDLASVCFEGDSPVLLYRVFKEEYYFIIQGVSGGIVNILGSGSMDYPE